MFVPMRKTVNAHINKKKPIQEFLKEVNFVSCLLIFLSLLFFNVSRSIILCLIDWYWKESVSIKKIGSMLILFMKLLTWQLQYVIILKKAITQALFTGKAVKDYSESFAFYSKAIWRRKSNKENIDQRQFCSLYYWHVNCINYCKKMIKEKT